MKGNSRQVIVSTSAHTQKPGKNRAFVCGLEVIYSTTIFHVPEA